jgi:hypothetical protein
MKGAGGPCDHLTDTPLTTLWGMPVKVKQPRHTYRGEKDWFEFLEAVGHREARARFMYWGDLSATVAGQLVWFLDEQIHLDRHLTERSRVRYRDILDTLDLDRVNRPIPRQFNSGMAAAA